MAVASERRGNTSQPSTTIAVEAHGSVSTPGFVDVDPFSKITSNTSTPSMPSTPERGAAVADDDEIEDYDAQSPDPDAIVSPVETNGFGDRPRHAPRKSIPIRLEKTEKRGRFMLHADDAEISDILQAGMHKKAAAGKRSAVRDLVFTRRFSTFDRQNPSSYDSPFHGFFTLFWIVMASMLLRVGAHNWKTYGSVLGPNQVIKLMVSRDLLVLGVSDCVMIGSTVVGLFFQKACAAGYINWGKTGWIIQNAWQTIFLGGCIGWTFYRDWPWTHTIFFVLHTVVYVMKQHSYNFYNGYLSQVLRRKKLLEKKLKQLEEMEPIKSPVTSPVASSRTDPFLGTNGDSLGQLRHRRKSSVRVDGAQKGGVRPPNMAHEPSDIAAIRKAITEQQPISVDQMDTYSDIIKDEIEAVTAELKGKCAVTQNHYPSNLTTWNWFEWSCLPTLVYELEYPRQAKTNWYYVAEKTAATFGTLMLMMTVSQAYIYPQVALAVAMKEQGAPLSTRWREFPWILSDMLFPLLIEQLLTWYVIWECILNVLAEVWRFADRGFYGPWWNSTSFDQYARDWNRPVHNFLLRHVYHSSISAFHLSKGSATFVTFLLSALVHELLMFCLFKKVRGYLFATQLMQVPLVMLSRTPLLKGQPTLGNVIFWIGLFVGPSFLTSLYLVL